MKRKRIASLIVGCLIIVFASPLYGQGRYPGERWEKTRRPEDLGWSSEKLRLAREYSQTIDTDAVVIVYDGMILDEWGETSQRFKLHSARKSFLSALYGIYAHEGRIKLDKTLHEVGIDDSAPSLTPAEGKATIRDVLKARSGVFHPGAYQGAVPNRPPRGSHPPGTFWFYSNWDFNVLGTIFEQETGTTIFQALIRRIAEPLQMEDFRLEDGYYYFGNESIHPAYPLRMTARDAARFGLLFLRQGRWGDRQIIPAEWVAESTRPYSDAGGGEGYGYMWWVYSKGQRFDGGAPLPGPIFFASGAGGHEIYVLPFADLVIVHRVNTDIPNRRVEGAQFQRLLRLILEARPSAIDQGLINTAREGADYNRPDLVDHYTKAVQSALGRGANPNARDDAGRTALMFAASSMSPEMVESLLKAGADVNAKDSFFGRTPLMYAAIKGNVGNAQILLNAKADNNARTALGQTALMEAAARGHTPVVQLLLAARADVNAKRRFGDTALMQAAANNQSAAIEALLNAGAEPNTQDQDGLAALMKAAKNGHTAVVRALLKARANPNLTDRGGQTALMMAAGAGETETLRLLIEAGANVNAQASAGQTALMWAAMRGRTPAIETLLAARADANTKSRYGQTALMLGAMFGQPDVVKALLAARADVQIKDNDGMTALDRALTEQQMEVVRLLGGGGAGKK